MKRRSVVHLAVAAAFCSGCADDPPPPPDLAAETTLGTITGVETGGVVAFRGLRYAAPPTGALRFRPPVPTVETYPPLAVADAPGAMCMQDPAEIRLDGVVTASEDCLFLDVITPSADDVRRPVMVWIHGGSLRVGSKSEPLYDGVALADRGNVVVVSINYRLGAFGFLDLSALPGSDYVESANLGLLDQTEALRWVRTHIAAFGGDPNAITVFGESAGAVSIAALLGTDEAPPLIDRAILQSGAASFLRPPSSARAVTDGILAEASETDLAGFTALSTDAIFAAQQAYLDKQILADGAFVPTVDGVVIPEQPMARIARGDVAGIPLLQGTTRDEARFWLEFVPILANLGPENIGFLAPWLVDSLGQARIDALTTHYAEAYPNDDLSTLLLRMATDVLFRMQQLRLAEAQAPHAPVYFYRYDLPTPYGDGTLGAVHSAEIPFVFFNLAPQPDWLLGTDPPESLAVDMSDAWVAFARTGNPNHRRLPRWSPYDLVTRSTMIFDATSRTELDPGGADRMAWDGIPFDGVLPAFR